MRHRGVLRLLCGTDFADFSGERTLLQLSPIAFDASTVEIWGALLHGGRCVLLPQRVPSVAELGRVVREAGVDTLPLTTSLYNAVIDEAPEVLAGVAQLLVGGEALSVHHVRKGLDLLPSVRFVACYGPTESTTFTCCYQVPRDLDPAARSILLGRPIGNTRVYLLDRHLEPVPTGTWGELCIGGAGLARGYLKRPELTAEKFIPDPFAGEPGERLYRTGDLARHLPGGLIEFGGRVDDQVKIRGFRIEPGEIEAALLRHAEVKEAAVLVREDVPGSKRLVAYLVSVAGASLDAREVRGFLAASLPEHMVPTAFQVLEALPLTPSGKVDRHALPAPERAAAERADRVAPRSEAERALAAIWEQLLGLQEIGVHDNFLELGGDSILSIQVVARASQAGLRLTPQQLFLHPTLAELAAVVGTAPATAAEQGLVAGEAPLTPVQAWFLERVRTAPHHWNQSLLLRSRQPLAPRALARSVDRLLAHHDALRLRFTRDGEGWTQTVAGLAGAPVFVVADLAALPAARRSEAVTEAAAAAQASLDLAAGPLLRALLFALGAEAESRLLLAIHHLAVDGVSWRVLLEDLQTAYAQALRGAAIALPAKTTSFRQWAARLAEHARSAAVRRELSWWLDQPWSAVAPLPVDHPGCASTEGSARQVSTALTPAETRALLQDVPAAYRTRINDVLLAALVRAFAVWTGERTLLIDMEGHGRDAFAEGLDVSRTVGWFTAIYPVLLTTAGPAGPGDDLKAAKETLRRVPAQGLGYGLLRFLAGDPEVEERLRALPRAEVLFNYLGQLDQVLPAESPFQPAPEPPGPPCDPRERRGHLLEINSLVADGCLRVDWTYGAGLHERATVEALAAAFLAELRGLIACCLAPGAGGCTPSDFPLAGLGQAELDRIAREPLRVE
ncbi:MAG TPA: condensation domain-containing protein, partial [Thermoanaerobaculia bacterium]|nr:condensation domain-containing protein [Thermoanaerobaculia bacterium]